LEVLHDLLLLALLIAIALGMLRLTNLIAIAILGGVYSLVLAVVYVLLDAVDVAFTEAAVGAGITLALMLAAISLTTPNEKPRPSTGWPAPVPLLTVLIVGAGLVYAVAGMPDFGSAAAPINHHVAPRYIETSPQEIGIPNMVTSILASYRGYDTMGEVTVIFTAGVSVIALLWRWTKDAS
jgi:multicomponent Na+:H+ antiporter subunit B